MSDKSIDKVLKEYFSQSGKNDWEKIATLEVAGKDPFEFLSWHGKDDILYLPYYDAEDVGNSDILSRFQIPAAKNSFSGARSWVNLPPIIVNDEETANANSLNQLSNGADGVMFDLRQKTQVNLNDLMHNIEWTHCFVAFQANESSFVNHLSTFIKNKFDPASLNGALFWESIPKKNHLDFYFNDCPHFKALGLVIAPGSPVMEICDALWRGVKTFEALSNGSHPENVFKSISFSILIDRSFVESIAKLKTLRMLWYQVAHAYGYVDYKLSDLHVQATVDLAVNGNFTPHENLLKNTFSGMAAILGGCDSLTIQSAGDRPFMSRIARNVSTILREESFFDKVADPLAGSYAIDTIVNAMAEKAWSRFQLKWQSS